MVWAMPWIPLCSCPSPFSPIAIFSICFITSWVRSSDAESGSRKSSQQIPLVLARNEAGGDAGETKIRQKQQAAIGDQHNHAHPKEHPDQPGIGVGSRRESALKSLKNQPSNKLISDVSGSLFSPFAAAAAERRGRD